MGSPIGSPLAAFHSCAVLSSKTQTEVEYYNTFIFDPAPFRGDVQETGFNDRFIKEDQVLAGGF
ncbi:MAG: hypothetical protein DME99_05595 [Verrucomicrobia bacterium]|nr:MAG: hypothetical protein DME99_05595 [Verrucomicrobiota bacterium]